MTFYVSDNLVATSGAVTANPTSTSTWQWLKDNTNIPGATANNYTVVEADIGSTIAVTDTETNMMGSASATSTAVGPILPFSPIALFENNEVGAWYDPSDLTTLFQDSAGTTPVTAVEQPVGLMLDKSKGLVLGPELVTNGTFDANINGWSVGNAGQSTLSWESGKIRITRVNSGSTYPNARTTITGLVIGRIYKIVSTTNNTFGIEAYHSIAGIAASTVRTLLTSKTMESVFTATATSHNLDVGIWDASGSIGQYVEFDNISVKELPGNHAFQSTSAARPVLSARYNLLTKTEQFNDAAWSKTVSGTGTTPVVTDAYLAVAAPDGTFTASRLQAFVAGTASGDISGLQRGSGSPTSSLTGRLWVRSNTGVNQTAWFRAGGAERSQTITPTWTEITDTGTIDYFSIGLRGSVSGAGTLDILLWHPDQRVTNDGVGIPTYQRVNTSTDYDTTGFPLYIKPNGSSQFMVTNSINFSATNKMTVFAGARRLSGATTAMFIELSVNVNTNNGTFYYVDPVAPQTVEMAIRGSTAVNILSTYDGGASPVTRVTSSAFDLSAATTQTALALRQNGVPVGSTGAITPPGGNFGTYPLYLFARGGSSLWYGGRMYGLIVRGAQSSAAQISAAETWMNGKTKAYA